MGMLVSIALVLVPSLGCSVVSGITGLARVSVAAFIAESEAVVFPVFLFPQEMTKNPITIVSIASFKSFIAFFCTMLINFLPDTRWHTKKPPAKQVAFHYYY